MKNSDKPTLLPADPTRSAAFALLSAVLDRHRPLDEALDQLPAMEPRDRAAAHRLAASALRRRGTIDALLEPYLKRTPPDAVMHILRLGAAGLLFLDTPAHAAVATAVGLARGRGFEKFAGLVNAVLRRVSENGAAALEELDGPRLDTPAWLWSAWGREARAIATAHYQEAPLDLSLKPGTAPPEGGVMLPTGSARFPAGTRVAELPGFAEGAFWVQDAAAALPAALLHLKPAETAADLCAAPGGKTAQMAASGAHIWAIELRPQRLRRLAENLARLNLPAETLQADAGAWVPPAPLDAVLLDAPCSATGTIRRHPDVPYLKQRGDVAALTETQDRLLTAAVAMLKPGGRLVYAVCSLQPEEGIERARAALARLPLTVEAITAAEVPELDRGLTPEGFLRTHPGLWAERGGLDGFFIARFRKR